MRVIIKKISIQSLDVTTKQKVDYDETSDVEFQVEIGDMKLDGYIRYHTGLTSKEAELKIHEHLLKQFFK